MAGWILPTLTNTYLQVSLIYLAVFFAYYPTTQVLFDRWLELDESLSHGLLIVAMSVHLTVKYLVIIDDRGLDVRKNGTIQGTLYVLGLIISSLIWLIFSSASINILEQILMPVILWIVLAIVFGHSNATKLILPVAFLYFAIPIWDYFNQVLVDLSSLVVGETVELFGITAFITGPKIELAYGTLLIAGGCSGLRYFTIALALSFYLSLDSKASITRKSLVIAVAVLCSLVANWIRIFWIVVAADMTNMQSDLIKDHEYFGWGVFAIALLPALYLGVKLLPPAPSNHIHKKAWKLFLRNSAPALLIFIGIITSYLLISAPTKRTQPSLITYGFSHQAIPDDMLVDAAYSRSSWSNSVEISEEVYINNRQTRDEKLVPFIGNNRNLENKSCIQTIFYVSGRWVDSYIKAKLLQALPAKADNKLFALARISTRQSCNIARVEIDQKMTELKYILTQALDTDA
ncbi:MAG: exosortase [Oleiphilaceae bacterium]|nr:exosortase [Oleiphilaceae bacterium]